MSGEENERLPGCKTAEDELTLAANLGVSVDRLRDARRYPNGNSPEERRQEFAGVYGLRAEFLPLAPFQEGGALRR